MIIQRNNELAETLRQNWATQFSSGDDGDVNLDLALDDSLTSLQWLHDLDINFGGHIESTGENKTSGNKPVTATVAPPGTASRATVKPIDYRTNPNVKPPFSYTTLICMAMGETQSKEITLASIYNWIRKNFVYYRMASPSWQNSIRHNLSLSKYFEKVPRRGNEPGKGGYWRISPEYRESLENGSFIKRRLSYDGYNHMIDFKRVKETPAEDEEVDDASLNIATSRRQPQEENAKVDWQIIMPSRKVDDSGSRVKTERIVDVTNNLATPLMAMNYLTSDDYSVDFEQLVSDDATDEDQSSQFHDDLEIAADWWFRAGGTGDLTPGDSVLKTAIASSLINDDEFDLYKRDLYEDIAAAFNVENLPDINLLETSHPFLSPSNI